MTKNYYETDGIGRSKYAVSFHDGVTTHSDGSPFYGIRLFTSLKARRAFVRDIVANGYVPREQLDRPQPTVTVTITVMHVDTPSWATWLDAFPSREAAMQALRAEHGAPESSGEEDDDSFLEDLTARGYSIEFEDVTVTVPLGGAR